MSDHLIAKANRHAMTLPTTHPTHADIAWYVREVDQLHAEVESLHRIANAIEKAGKEQGARAERAEAEVEELKESILVQQIFSDDRQRAERAEAELAAAKERLRSEAMDDYASIKDLQRELATERARLNWLETPSGMDWQWEPERLTVSRASIDAAMKEDAK